MKATRSRFSSGVRWSARTRLKNSTVSSRVKHRPSWRYGGLSLMPRSANVLIGPRTLINSVVPQEASRCSSS